MTWVVDSGPLSHFAKSGWLGVLKMLAPEHRVIIPDVVRHELEIAGPSQIHLPPILQQDWIRTRAVDSMEELAALGRYTARLVDVRRTLGLLCEAVREGHLTEEMISELADDLAASNYRVPFAPGGFIEWAKQNEQLG